MAQFPSEFTSIYSPEPDSVRRLLNALGEWGVAEVQGVPEPRLEQLAEQAMNAYRDIAAVA